jgi:cell division protein FtsW
VTTRLAERRSGQPPAASPEASHDERGHESAALSAGRRELRIVSATASPIGLSARRARAPDLGGVAEKHTRFLDRPLASYYLIMGTAGLLVVLGLVMVLSASSVASYSATGSSFTVAARQAIWVGVGLPLAWVASRLPVRVYRKLAYPLLLVSLVLLAAVIVPGIGTRSGGAVRWIDLPGGLQLQPAEIAKLALVVWGAHLLVRKERRLGQVRHLVVPLLPVVLVMVGLVMIEPDLGTTAVIVLVFLGLLWTVGVPGRLFGAAVGLVGAGVGVLAVIAPYRLTRLTSFAHPFAHPQTVGYQAVQGIYALASGGWWGVGLGASREKWDYLPNQYTDYIFAVIGEELGLIGTLAVLALFGVLGYAGFRIARRSTDRFSQLAAAAATIWLFGQALINMGYVVGLLPVTGVPLPMVSYGGSSLLPTLFAVGMLASFARREPAAAAALDRRRRTSAGASDAGSPARRPARCR